MFLIGCRIYDFMEEAVRLNKYLSDNGVCSRRQADRLIEEGSVTVDGKTAVLGTKVLPNQTVEVNGKKVEKDDDVILLIFNKPRGITCTTSKSDKTNVVDYINYPKRVYPIGRLDKYSEGLLLLTNKGDMVNGLMRSRYGHEKEYVVTIDRPVTEEFISKITSGVEIDGIKTKKCFAEIIKGHTFRIIITQGINRQIRKMCESLGCRVVKLQRIRIMDIHLGNLGIGKFREATKKEKASILKLKAE